jgi:hypothetical protein
MSTPSLVQSIATEFKGRASEEVQVFLDIAMTMVDSTVWGDKYDYGVAYLAAHLMTMTERKGVGGAVIKEHVGEITVQYSQPNTDAVKSLYLATSYGQIYLSLRSQLVLTPLARS